MPKEELQFRTKEYITTSLRISQILDSGVHLTLTSELYSFADSNLKNFEIGIHKFGSSGPGPEYLFKGFLSDLVDLIEDYQKLKRREES